jgi:hypothetical protein
MEVSGQLQPRPWLLNPQGKSPPGTHWIGGWVGLRASLDAVEVIEPLPSSLLLVTTLTELSRLIMYPEIQVMIKVNESSAQTWFWKEKKKKNVFEV